MTWLKNDYETDVFIASGRKEPATAVLFLL
jgi:hypothetical protein